MSAVLTMPETPQSCFTFAWHKWSKKDPAPECRIPCHTMELCINLCGEGRVRCDGSSLPFFSGSCYVAVAQDHALHVERQSGTEHCFLRVSLSRCFLVQQVGGSVPYIHSSLRDFFSGRQSYSSAAISLPLQSRHRNIYTQFKSSGCARGVCELRNRGLILQLLSEFIFEPCCADGTNCDEPRCASRERARKVAEILRTNLEDPPTLETIGRQVGCSPFHLSRIFSKEMGMTIPQYLRHLRMEKAAELLRHGSYNVTEAAVSVGYSSMSHFSRAFHRAMGCCPAAYINQGVMLCHENRNPTT